MLYALNVLRCAWRLALSALLAVLAVQAWRLPGLLDATLVREGAATRAAAVSAIHSEAARLDARLGSIQGQTFGEVSRTRLDLLERVDRLTEVSERSIAGLTWRADAQLTKLNETVASNLGRANDSLADVSQTAAALRPALDNTAKITAQIDDALPLYLDCDHNADCVFNRYVGVAQSTEKAMREVARTAPGTLKSVESTASSVASIANSWEKQTPIYIRALGWAGSLFMKVKTLFL